MYGKIDVPSYGIESDVVRQLFKSLGSVMDNLAEGFDRGGNEEFIHFLSIAQASLTEAKSQLYRCHDFSIISDEQFGIYLNSMNQISA